MFLVQSPLDNKETDTSIMLSHREYLPDVQMINETLLVDLVCQQEADRAGIPGVFVSLLSTHSRSFEKIVSFQRDNNLPIINVKVSSYRMQHKQNIKVYAQKLFIISVNLCNSYLLQKP